MSRIHPTAVVDPKAELGRDVEIGPYCCVGPGVMLGDGCRLVAHVTLSGPSEFGPNNIFYPFVALGEAPQDLKYKGGPTRLVVGSHNVFREHVTAHRGTEVDRQSGGVTRIGDHNLFMIGVHIAHDAEIGNHVILSNHVQVAGHVRIEDQVAIGGVTGLHHFVTIGRLAFVAAMSRVGHDVPPYMMVGGYDQAVRGVNIEGLRRWGIAEASIEAIKAAGRLLYGPRGGGGPATIAEALRRIEADGLVHDEHVRYLVQFLRQRLDGAVFGRVRELRRSDTPDDRAEFYQFKRPEKQR
jgi:UDP-N-acetylglucosamine acyltransferase